MRRASGPEFSRRLSGHATVPKVYDDLDFQHGVQAFLNGIASASAYGIREGIRSAGGRDHQTVLIMEIVMDSKSLFLTPNSESLYNVWLDLKGGPLAIESRPYFWRFLARLLGRRRPQVPSRTRGSLRRPIR